MVAAVQVTHTAFQVAAYEPYIALAERLKGTLVASFAAGMASDKSAVRAAITGTVVRRILTEGQIKKLKLVKRQMYGRANFDMLQASVPRAA